MKIHTPMLLASLVLLQPSLGSAKAPITIPEVTFQQMKKGHKLERVWSGPGFDGTKGVKLGAISDETEDFAGVVLEYFPLALRKLTKSDAPYTLHLAVIGAKLKSSSSGSSSANVEVEGRVVDQGGAIVSAFTAYAISTNGGNESDNARIAVNTIVYAINKDLFPSTLPSIEKGPAVIVPAPDANTAALTPSTPAPKPNMPSPAMAQAPEAPVAPAAPVVPRQASLIPAAIASTMKAGSSLSLLWIDPAYDRSRGFVLGEVRYRVEARNDGIDKVLPESLAEIATPDAPCILELQIVELTIRSQSRGVSTVHLGVEGRLVTKEGALVAAFKTRETITGTGDSIDDCRQASRKVVRAIGKDLR